MPRLIVLLLLPMLLAAGCRTAPEEATKPESAATDVNLLLFRHARSKRGGTDMLLPFYLYDYDNETREREFLFVPLLSGFNVSPTNEYWFSMPLLTLFGASRAQKTEASYFASLGLLTFSSSEISPHYESHEFVSLPLLARSSRRIYRGSRGTVTYETWSAPLPLLSSERIVRESKVNEGERLEILRRSLITLPMGGEDRLSLAEINTWGEDRQLQMFNLFNFSLFGFARFRGRYPGARFLEQMAVSPDAAEGGAGELPEADQPVVTHFNLFGPMISLRTNVVDDTRWEFLPLFSYRKSKEGTSFRVIPLLFELRDGSPRLSLTNLTKLWPLLYHDEYRRRWDILWPLAYYRDDEIEDRTELRVRLLFRYYQKADYSELRLLDGLLYSEQGNDEKRSSSVLLGYLYSSESEPAKGYYRWDILRGLLFGMSQREGETPTYRFFFLRVGGKKIAGDEDKKSGEGKKEQGKR